MIEVNKNYLNVAKKCDKIYMFDCDINIFVYLCFPNNPS